MYDYRINVHHTLKKNLLKLEDLQNFITCYNPKIVIRIKETFSDSKPSGHWRKFKYGEFVARVKTSTMADLNNLPDSDTLAEEIVENAEAGLKVPKRL